MLSRLFIAALRSPAGKGQTFWLLFVMSNCDLVAFPCGIEGQVWYLIVLIHDLCSLSYFYMYLYVRQVVSLSMMYLLYFSMYLVQIYI